MTLAKQQALDLFRSGDLIGIGMEANALRRKLHPEGVANLMVGHRCHLLAEMKQDRITRQHPNYREDD